MGTEPFVRQVVNAPNLYSQGCLLEKTGPLSVSISSGQLRDSKNFFDIKVLFPLAIDFSVPGLGGLQSGAAEANTWYAIFVLSSKLQNALPLGMAVKSDSVDSLPSIAVLNSGSSGKSYDISRFLGWVRTNASVEIENFKMVPTGGGCRKVFWEQTSVALTFANTSFQFDTATLSDWVPPTGLEFEAVGTMLGIPPTSQYDAHVTFVPTEPPTINDYYFDFSVLITEFGETFFSMPVGRNALANNAMGIGGIVDSATVPLNISILSYTHLI